MLSMEEIVPPKLSRTGTLIDLAIPFLRSLNRAWGIRKGPLVLVYLEIMLSAKSTPRSEC
jgi:hypothetical protein